MKKYLILLILLFVFVPPAQALHTWNVYVDPDAGGANDGGRDGGDPNDPTQAANWTDAYLSLEGAFAGEAQDLTSTDRVIKFMCRSSSGGDDTAKVGADDFTTDATRYVWVYGYDFPTDGILDATKYNLYNNDAQSEMVDCREENIVWENIQFRIVQTSTNSRYGIGIYVVEAGNLVTIKNCIIQGNCTSTGAAYGIQINDADANVNIYNTIVYDFESATDPHTDFRGINIIASTAVNIWNSTIEGCNYGINGVFTIKNSAVFNNADDFNGTPTADYNATDDDDDRGTNGVDLNKNASGEWTASFTNYGTNTYSVKDASAPIYNVGTDDPGGAAQDGDDITGFARTSTWDIGAFEWDDSGSGDPGGQGSDSGGIKYGFKNGGGKDGGKQN